MSTNKKWGVILDAGIVSYGVSVPRCRLSVDEVLNVWRNTHKQILKRMGYDERGVLYPDQDTITLSVDAGVQALSRCQLQPQEIGALILGTGTNPYSTKASVTVIAEALGLRKDIISFDLQFAGKSGTSAIIAALAMVKSGQVDYAIAIGADTINRHIPPGHLLDYGASAGAVAFVIGKENIIAPIVGHASYAQDQNDIFRLEGERYLQVGCGVKGYAYGWGIPDNMVAAGQALYKKLGISSEDVDDCALHQNSLIAPMFASKPLEIDFKEQVFPHVYTPKIGDCGAASCLIPLAGILDKGEADRRVLVGSFGSGAGSDFLYLETAPELEQFPNKKDTLAEMLEDKIMLDYGTAQKYEYKYLRPLSLVTGNL